MYSPHAWGWSDGDGDGLHPGQVFPTCVGMVRWMEPMSQSVCSIPHMRGDGPEDMERGRGEKSYSPHAWGWSVRRKVAA